MFRCPLLYIHTVQVKTAPDEIQDYLKDTSNMPGGHAERLVVHCQVGVSRSPGVALGLCDRFGWPAGALEDSYPFFNRWVRRVLVNHPRRGQEHE